MLWKAGEPTIKIPTSAQPYRAIEFCNRIGGKADISAADASAIDIKSLSGHEGRIVAGKKGDCANQIARHFGRLIACIVAANAKSSSMLAKPGRGLRARVPGDRVRPGEIALTVMPSSPSSVARARVNPTTPPLLAT